MENHSTIIAVARSVIEPDEGPPLALEYYVRLLTGPEDEVLYGLRADKRHQDGALLERQETPALTGSLKEATSIASYLAEQTVTPNTLMDIIDDYYESFFPSSVHATGKNQSLLGK